MCDIDELCPPNEILKATNGQNFPGVSNLWSTAETCQSLIEGARDGTLLSGTGCNSFKTSINAVFKPGIFGLGVFDLSQCGFQCKYDEATVSAESPSIQIKTVDTFTGRIESEGSKNGSQNVSIPFERVPHS
jgi:hypothetical protein